MRPVRLGEVLVRRGLLTEAQVEEILAAQRERHRPFGVLAERLHGLSEADIESAWAEQYASLTGSVDVRREPLDERAMSTVSRRQCWQFRVMPVRFDDSGDLVLATTADSLPRALRFALRVLERPCSFLITESRMLGEALGEHFPLAGMTGEEYEEADRLAFG